MSAAELIALETVLADLGSLYTAARAFVALRDRAEKDLLPVLGSLAARLRRLLRANELTERAIEAAAREIADLDSQWKALLDDVRHSAAYQRARHALVADDQGELAISIPLVFANLRAVVPRAPIYFPLSVSTGRRRPGFSPFLDVVGCADKIVRVLGEGLAPEPTGDAWWESELPSLSAADDPGAFDSPVALGVAPSDLRVSAFAASDEPGYRLFTPRLRASMTVAVAAEATDEWWEAYEDSYAVFRDKLREELARRGYAVSVGDG